MRPLVLACAILLATSAARAQQSTAFDAEQFHPAATSNGYFAVDGAFVAPHLGFSAGAYMSYAHDPLVLRRSSGIREVIADQVGMDVVGSFALFNHLELGIDLPFSPLLGAPSYDASAHVPSVNAAALGDLRADLKALLWTPRAGEHRFGLALVIGGSFPTGDATSFYGESSVVGRPRLVGQWRSRWASLALSLGAVLRGEQVYGTLHVGHQLSYGAAVNVALPASLAVLAELNGLVGVGLPAGVPLTSAEAPAEISIGLRWLSSVGLALELAGGAGLTRGYGTPDGRLIAGLRYVSLEQPGSRPRPHSAAPPPPAPDPMYIEPAFMGESQAPRPDRDRDGTPDDEDRCPDKAGPADNQGCPDFDSDGDGIVDRVDKCPFDAEIFNGVADDDGCPDAPPAVAVLNGDKIVIFEPVQFDSGSPAVDARSSKLLSIVAHILNLHPEILKLRVAAHADRKSEPKFALQQTRARANSVRRWLIDNGHVDAQRLSAQGFGADRPLGKKKLDAIEFVVIQRLDVDAP